MADLANKPIEGEQAKAPKQDTREMMLGKLRELREKIDPMLEDKDMDLALVERFNQIFNDAIASLPPDPRPDPVYQRATLSSTLTKIRMQIEGVLATSTKPELVDRFKEPIVSAEEEAKKTDEEQGVPPPAGPSQSPQDLQRQAYEHPAPVEDAPEPEYQQSQPQQPA